MTLNYRSDCVYLLGQEWSNLNDTLYQALAILLFPFHLPTLDHN